MINWYSDEELSILFSEKPDITVLYSDINTPKNEKKDINLKPFRLENEVQVILKDQVNQEIFEFTIPQYYRWDGASIPIFFWRLIGAKSDNRFLIPSLVHDVLCENHDYVDGERYFSTIVFERLLYVSGVNPFKRWMMKHSVDNFQKFQKWG